MRHQETPQSMGRFNLIWAGQLVSLLGSSLTGYAIGLWFYLQTGSVTNLALIMVCNLLPMIVVSPVAGVLVDRLNRRLVLIASDSGSAVCSLALALLLALGRLDLTAILIIVTLNATCGTFQRPAFSAIVPQLVPPEQLGRANGMLASSQGISQLLAPILGGVLITIMPLSGIILIDVLSFIVSLITLARVHVPTIAISRSAGGPSVWEEARSGWMYVVRRQGLLALMVFMIVGNFLGGLIQVLLPALMLDFTTPNILGVVTSVGGFGLIVGGILMGTWGGFKRQAIGVLGGYLLCGISLVIVGLQPLALVILAGLFLLYLGMAVVQSSTQALFQSKAPAELQGRIGAALIMNNALALLIGNLVSGPLADYVFKPLLLPESPLASTLGPIIGVGAGRGIGLMFILVGALVCLLTVGGVLYPRLRRVDIELPNVAGQAPAVQFDLSNEQGSSVMA